MKLGVSSFTFPWAIGGIEPEHPVAMSAFELLERARDLKADVLQIADNLPIGELAEAELLKLKAQADSYGIAIENHDRLTCAEFNEIIDQVGSDWVGICLDTVNSLGAVEAPNTVIPALAPRAINVHMKDFEIVRTNGQMGFTVRGTALGEGRLDVAEVITAVGGTKREITAVIELWTPRQDSYEATVALENEWAEISVTNLRKSIGS
jgi:sugar phosphate isomerase/epimerase